MLTLNKSDSLHYHKNGFKEILKTYCFVTIP